MTITGLLVCGCESSRMQNTSTQAVEGFTIQRVRISALTDFVVSRDDPQKREIKTYAELLDAYDSQLKSPCIFRFELYEYKPLVGNPRGKRLIIWPDVDLTSPGKNNQHWKDYLRSYEFYLPLGFSPQPDRNYLLEVTCMTGEKRFNGYLKIRYRP